METKQLVAFGAVGHDSVVVFLQAAAVYHLNARAVVADGQASRLEQNLRVADSKLE